MTRTTIPAGILELRALTHDEGAWSARLAAIPAWHPRNEVATPTIPELRTAVRSAFDVMAAASTAIDGLAADSTDEQRSAAQTALTDAEAAHRSAGEALTRAEQLEAHRNALPPADDTDQRGGGDGGDTRVVSEPVTYERGNGQSYFLDLARAKRTNDDAATERLRRHSVDIREISRVRDETAQRATDAALEAMLADLPVAAQRAIQRLGGPEAAGIGLQRRERRALSRIDGQGGHFVPPIWLMDAYAILPRAVRPFVDALRHIDLPNGTDSINIPKIVSGTATAIQTADNAAVQQTDLADAVVNAPVRTITGQQVLPLQLIEQSPLAFDEIVFADLTADYWYQTEVQALNGLGTSGQVKGIIPVAQAGGQISTYTDASPTVPKLYPKIAGALSLARTARKRPITHGWWVPARGYWAMSSLDAQSRPLVVPQVGAYNALGTVGTEQGGGSGEDPPISVMGVWHRMSDAIPTNQGAGTNQDIIIETRMADHVWFEGALRARALEQTLAGNLQMLLQVYAYVATTFERYPQGIGLVQGTGLTAPTF